MRVVCPSCGRSYVVGSAGKETPSPFLCSCGSAIDPAAAVDPQGAEENPAGDRQGSIGVQGLAEPAQTASRDTAAMAAASGEGRAPSPLLVALLYVLSFCMCIVSPIWALIWLAGRDDHRRRHGRNALIIFGVMLAIGLVVAAVILCGGGRSGTG